ncbi:N-acetylglucosamine-6-phosphate deacetylase [Acetobacteraceae bacterium ESL0709]|nr:N-acetylglucosamine-6-phosphate deacetylase [Acetobacteraceae bacterium ESL0697]MDF7678865.1 N-acetylglucosamine-6-phosphate deacetylase [Acetobacteraceae bacterium ESL0709]
MRFLDGKIIFRSSVEEGIIEFDDQIRMITPFSGVSDRYILPGFIDAHVHGGDGADMMDGVDALKHMARFHLRHGTTTILPTTITRPWEDIKSALQAVSLVISRGIEGGPHIHGVHLEGPFISPHRLGAQPAFALEPTPERLAEILAYGCVRVVTMAPELLHAETAMKEFAKAGVRVSIGHTRASYEQTERSLCLVCQKGGTVGATHLFNAMQALYGREPGPVGAFLCEDAAYAEMIFDTHHVHPANFRLASKIMKNRLLFVTDAMRGAGQKEGISTLGGQEVMIRDGVVRLPDGTLAGSVLTLDQAFRNAVNYGASLPTASRLVSTNAARYLGLSDRGEISEGRLADFVVMDSNLDVKEVWVKGVRCYQA